MFFEKPPTTIEKEESDPLFEMVWLRSLRANYICHTKFVQNNHR